MEVKFKGKLLRLTVQKCRLPNGRTTVIEVVRHPGAVLIVPLLPNQRLILLRQYRPSIGQYLWELPAGTINPGERPWLCARRELIEETGFKARSWRKVGKIIPVPGYSDEVIHLFEAKILSPAFAAQDLDEIIRPVEFTKAQIRLLFRQGKIIDAKTICGLVHTGWL